MLHIKIRFQIFSLICVYFYFIIVFSIWSEFIFYNYSFNYFLPRFVIFSPFGPPYFPTVNVTSSVLPFCFKVATVLSFIFYFPKTTKHPQIFCDSRSFLQATHSNFYFYFLQRSAKLSKTFKLASMGIVECNY